MKKLSTLAILLAFTINLLSIGTAAAAVRVKSYYTKKGTYVQSYVRTSPNYTKINNYSTKGNYNPYTGKKGYVSPVKTYKFR